MKVYIAPSGVFIVMILWFSIVWGDEQHVRAVPLTLTSQHNHSSPSIPLHVLGARNILKKSSICNCFAVKKKKKNKNLRP